MRALFGGMVLLACAVACGSSGGGASSPGAAGEGASGGGAGATGGAGTELCPDGTAPTGTEPTQCPELMPTGGTCCSEPGMACFYPGDDDSYRKLGLCFDDPQHPPYWQETLVLDRMLCQEASDAIEIGSDALACSERETVPCDPQGIVTPQELLDGQFDDLVVQCGGLPNESSLEVEFTDGCATGLVASISGPVDDSAPLRSCIEQALDKVHFACADGLDCAGTGRSTLK